MSCFRPVGGRDRLPHTLPWPHRPSAVRNFGTRLGPRPPSCPRNLSNSVDLIGSRSHPAPSCSSSSPPPPHDVVFATLSQVRRAVAIRASSLAVWPPSCSRSVEGQASAREDTRAGTGQLIVTSRRRRGRFEQSREARPSPPPPPRSGSRAQAAIRVKNKKKKQTKKKKAKTLHSLSAARLPAPSQLRRA